MHRNGPRQTAVLQATWLGALRERGTANCRSHGTTGRCPSCCFLLQLINFFNAEQHESSERNQRASNESLD
jgi:hypothetical protein